MNTIVINFSAFHIHSIFLSNLHLYCNCAIWPNVVIDVAFPQPVSSVCLKLTVPEPFFIFKPFLCLKTIVFFLINIMFLILGLSLFLHVEFRFYIPAGNETWRDVRPSQGITSRGTRPLSVTRIWMLGTWSRCCQVSPGGIYCPPCTPTPTLTPAPSLPANKQSVGRWLHQHQDQVNIILYISSP